MGRDSGAFRRAARIVKRVPLSPPPPRPEPVWPDAAVVCPVCGRDGIVWDFTCHTWPRTDAGGEQRWMSCMPCDSAVEYYCTAEGCAWLYTHGLNPRNPRSAANEQRRPPWIPDARTMSDRFGFIYRRPEVPFWEDADEDD